MTIRKLRRLVGRMVFLFILAACLAGTDIYLVSDGTLSFAHWPCRLLMIGALLAGIFGVLRLGKLLQALINHY